MIDCSSGCVRRVVEGKVALEWWIDLRRILGTDSSRVTLEWWIDLRRQLSTRPFSGVYSVQTAVELHNSLVVVLLMSVAPPPPSKPDWQLHGIITKSNKSVSQVITLTIDSKSIAKSTCVGNISVAGFRVLYRIKHGYPKLSNT